MRRLMAYGLLLALGCTLLAIQARPAVGEAEAQPLDGLGPDELARFEAGRERFVQVHGAADGLGPLFNARSCAECHAVPGPGGSDSSVAHQVVMFGRFDSTSGSFDPLAEQGGPMRGQRSIHEELPRCRLAAEKVPREANVKAQRQPAPLYGLGLVEAILDEAILAQVELGKAADPGEVSGRPNLIDGRVGRLGWKAQAASLEQFISLALADELGLTSPLRPDEQAPQGGPIPDGCDLVPDPEDDGSQLAALVDFVSLLGPLPRAADSDGIQRGELVFQQVGCPACHTRGLWTGPSAVAALNEREVPLYSDLLLHDMGEYLADDTVQGQAGSRDWRTTPLWGLSRKSLYLHDGRTADLRQVIDLHTGEARAARYRLRQRPKNDLEDLLAFLRSL